MADEKSQDKTGDSKPLPELAQVVADLKIENEKKAKLLDEEKKLIQERKDIAALNILSGKTNEGTLPAPVKEETAREYYERISGKKK
jgi:hypothetical protein